MEATGNSSRRLAWIIGLGLFLTTQVGIAAEDANGDSSDSPTAVASNDPTVNKNNASAEAINWPTALYVSRLRLDHFTTQGTDYVNPWFSPQRICKPLEKIDAVYDYDFNRLKQVEARLRGVDRRAVLRRIFAEICAGAKSNTERHLSVVEFLHQSLQHCYPLQPMHEERVMVCDPLTLLELGEGRCGQVNRLALDLFDAAGYPGRLCQVNYHVCAEVYYDDRWHFLDAGAFGLREAPINDDGIIPSLAELSRAHHLIDRLTLLTGVEVRVNYSGDLPYYPSYCYFADLHQEHGVYVKTATAEQAANSPYYGWNYLVKQEPDRERKLDPNLKPRSQPRPPELCYIKTAAQSARGIVGLEWKPSFDGDHDVLGYRVFVSRRSRGWGYHGPSLPEHLMRYKSTCGVWRPEMYGPRFTIPPHEVADQETTDTRIELGLPAPGRYFISVMPFDAYGQSVGKPLYHCSEEIVIDLPASGHLESTELMAGKVGGAVVR